ncbi:hypothetical protein [Gynuella sunshinyii]|uniref:Uncharacterized protein n=1 Tax=Gynuella sunshinyii YC6258 TaxID=1445510 RepID=A0A0C5UZQ2_9GAMM|nr:hypothetical protein [Gynuella sunshinyii]AJQ92755.1 hypothetical Protein YC6258_00705 [Gynuella sunshinyii YC6258]
MDRESWLFYVVLFIFTVTAIVTLLGIIQKLSIKEQYLNKLFTTLVLELVTAVIYMFSQTDFFSNNHRPDMIVLARTELEDIYADRSAQDIVATLKELPEIQHKLQQAEQEVTQLTQELQLQQPGYDEVTLALADTREQLSQLQLQLADTLPYKSKYLALQKQFLVRMAHLNALISEWGTSINLRYRPEEKKEVALLLQEALKEIGFMDANMLPDDDPVRSYELLVAYQKKKRFSELGYLTSEVVAFIIQDYLAVV